MLTNLAFQHDFGAASIRTVDIDLEKSPDIAPKSTTFGQIPAEIGRQWAEFGQSRRTFGPNSANYSPSSSRVGPNSVEFGQSCLGINQNWPGRESTNVGSTLAKLCQSWIKAGPEVTKIIPILPHFGQDWAARPANNSGGGANLGGGGGLGASLHNGRSQAPGKRKLLPRAPMYRLLCRISAGADIIPNPSLWFWLCAIGGSRKSRRMRRQKGSSTPAPMIAPCGGPLDDPSNHEQIVGRSGARAPGGAETLMSGVHIILRKFDKVSPNSNQGTGFVCVEERSLAASGHN